MSNCLKEVESQTATINRLLMVAVWDSTSFFFFWGVGVGGGGRLLEGEGL